MRHFVSDLDLAAAKLVPEKNKKTNGSCIVGSSVYLTFENSLPGITI